MIGQARFFCETINRLSPSPYRICGTGGGVSKLFPYTFPELQLLF